MTGFFFNYKPYCISYKDARNPNLIHKKFLNFGDKIPIEPGTEVIDLCYISRKKYLKQCMAKYLDLFKDWVNNNLKRIE